MTGLMTSVPYRIHPQIPSGVPPRHPVSATTLLQQTLELLILSPWPNTLSSPGCRPTTTSSAGTTTSSSMSGCSTSSEAPRYELYFANVIDLSTQGTILRVAIGAPRCLFAPSSPIPPARSSVCSPQSDYPRSNTLTSPTLFPSPFMEEYDLQHLVADSNSTTFRHEGMSRVSYMDDGHHQIMGKLDNGERPPRASVSLDLSSDVPALIPCRKEEDRLSRISLDISFPREQESAVGGIRNSFCFVALYRFL